ncbi:MAG: GTP-binding protein [Candidatus Levybacteria bacterium]|nr:GTP-binding protein [Candidatus Levybacteria bacterium]
MVKNKKLSTAENTLDKFYLPVVAVLGHVDHGKTTLLDAIRKTDVVKGEHGGITQRIGASTVEVVHENIKRRITFIDTPGHETFSKMRSRGAQVADIGLLIVAATDGVMPQTKESIELLKAANIPYIVVLTKSDMPEKNPEKVKQQLLKEGILLEGFGGDVSYIEVSAKTGSNVKELLELILLVLDMHRSAKSQAESLAEKDGFKAIVIESKLDQKMGPKATIIVKSGSVSVKDELICEDIQGRVRTLINDQGEHIQNITVGEAAEVLGFEKVPNVGSVIYKKEEFVPAATPQKEVVVKPVDFSAPEDAIPVIIRTDTLGSLEAITQALPEKIIIVSSKTGEVTPADVMLAKSVKAIMLGFNVKIRPDVANLAKTEKVLLKNYTIIYELLDEIKEALEGKALSLQEVIYGRAKILASFPFEKTKVLGVGVLEGRVAKGDRVRLMRREDIVGESMISSVRQGKNPVSKVEKGQEAGVILSPMLDFTIGDMLICHG